MTRRRKGFSPFPNIQTNTIWIFLYRFFFLYLKCAVLNFVYQNQKELPLEGYQIEYISFPFPGRLQKHERIFCRHRDLSPKVDFFPVFLSVFQKALGERMVAIGLERLGSLVDDFYFFKMHYKIKLVSQKCTDSSPTKKVLKFPRKWGRKATKFFVLIMITRHHRKGTTLVTFTRT